MAPSPSSATRAAARATRSSTRSKCALNAPEEEEEPEVTSPPPFDVEWRRRYETLARRRRAAHCKPSALHPRVPGRWKHLGLEDDRDGEGGEG